MIFIFTDKCLFLHRKRTKLLHHKLHVYVCACVCVCVWPWTGPIWKQLLAARALRHPQCLSLRAKRNASPSPFSSVSPFLSFSPSVFFTTSLFLYLSRSLSLSLWSKLLSYEPQQRGKVNPLFCFFYWEQKPRPYFNSHHTFPICANKPWKYQR